ncbi:SET and MYND domain-containing protein 4-like [Phymastichus coffea]|uniref:SET and MYND domain-containing protein 4-like n=1 Tax=Phymastichus coffea TaxID=108790 RepID=UPI00273C11EE|nr:SET and MYND domain-containing protein 4-like [Phymastichus coffea]
MENRKHFLQELLEVKLYFHNQEKTGNIFKKCSEVSERARKDGNQLYIKKHNKQIHQDILSLYTKSIAFAPTGSEKLALGYSNRSALLIHLHHYEECIIDIAKALECTKSEELKSKLNDRKKKCLRFIKERKTKLAEEALHKSVKSLNLYDEEIVDTVLELPNIINSVKTLRITKSVTLKYNKMYGRHYIANKDIKPGDIIIAEKTYACFPKLDQIYLVCSHCLSFTWVGIPCDFCVFSIYCSEACKKVARKEYHDIECSVLPCLYTDTDLFRTGMRLATRMIIKAVKAEGFQNVINLAKTVNNDDNGTERMLLDISLGESKFGTCYNLQSFPNRRQSNYDTFSEGVIIYLLFQYTNIIYKEKPDIMNISDDNIFILKNILMKLGDIINLNQYCFQSGCTCPNILNECQNDCNFPKGHFIAPFSSLVNHSCIPNTLMLNLPQRTVVLFATQTIKKNEQIFYSYGPLLDGKDMLDRNSFLRDHYYFTCKCTACKENWSFNYNLTLNKSDSVSWTKLLLEFQQMLFAAKEFKENQFINNQSHDWQQIDEVSLHQALKLSELVYKHFKNQAAFNYNIRFRRYVRKALYILYGEKYDMPNQC